MADDQPPAPRKVVKRVVKKSTTPAPTVRYGRPVTPAEPAPPAAPRAEPKVRSRRRAVVVDEPTEVVSAGTATAVEDRVDAPEPAPAPRRSVDVGAAVRRARSGASASAGAVGTGVGRVAVGTGRVVSTGVGAVRRFRLPTIDPVPASLLTGLVVGAVAVLLGRAALELFSALRGVASGGGTWGSLTLVVVGFVAFAAGELLLDALGAPQPRIASFLGVTLTVIAMLGLFLEQSDSPAALYLVPALGATAFTLAHWLVVAAESSPDEP